MIDEENQQVGIVSKDEALERAKNAGLDLVEVAPTSVPPVCRIMDYGKWLYEEKRKKRESKKKSVQHSQLLKEIRLRPETDKHDLEIKAKKAREFIEKGHKVQFTVIFKGRQMLHQDRGHDMLSGIAESMGDIAKVDRSSKMTNKKMIMMLMPK